MESSSVHSLVHDAIRPVVWGGDKDHFMSPESVLLGPTCHPGLMHPVLELELLPVCLWPEEPGQLAPCQLLSTKAIQYVSGGVTGRTEGRLPLGSGSPASGGPDAESVTALDTDSILSLGAIAAAHTGRPGLAGGRAAGDAVGVGRGLLLSVHGVGG